MKFEFMECHRIVGHGESNSEGDTEKSFDHGTEATAGVDSSDEQESMADEGDNGDDDDSDDEDEDEDDDHNSSSGARLTKAYDVTIQRYRNSHAKIHDSKMHILRCMDSKFCVKFQRCPLKFHTKFWTHTPPNMHFMRW